MRDEHFTSSDSIGNRDDFTSVPNLIRTDKDFSIKERFVVTDNERITRHGQKINLTVPPSVYTLLLTDFFVGIRSVSVAPTLSLPKASLAGLGKIYIVKDLSGSATSTTITISPQTGETINGDTGTSISTNYGFLGLFTDGANWFTS